MTENIDLLKAKLSQEVVGKTIDEARVLFNLHPGFTLNVTWEDGISFGSEKNIDPQRLQVGVEKGVIVDKWNIRTNQDGETVYTKMRWT
jgi:hypothetical protein